MDGNATEVENLRWQVPERLEFLWSKLHRVIVKTGQGRVGDVVGNSPCIQISRRGRGWASLSESAMFNVPMVSTFSGYTSHTASQLLEPLRQPAGRNPFGVHMRTLGDVAYFMTSVTTPASTVRALEEVIMDTLSDWRGKYRDFGKMGEYYYDRQYCAILCTLSSKLW